MTGALSLRFSTQAQMDVRRITRELSDIQAQIASGAKARDLQGFGGASSRLLNAQSMVAASDSRSSVLAQLQARFGVQGAALGQVADATTLLSQAIRDALSANDGRGVSLELDLSFSSIVSAMNETWNGQPLFAGERQNTQPIKFSTLDELQTLTAPEDMFDESERHQTIELSAGEPAVLSAKASELSQGLFNLLRSLKNLVDANGGVIGQPIDGADRNVLQALAGELEEQAQRFTTEEGRAGQLATRFEQEQVRLQQRSNLLVKEIGETADADIADLTIRLNSLLVQYEASAKTFSDLSNLSLLNYLR
jgi:flagellar hook-associated protein 3 FlgL